MRTVTWSRRKRARIVEDEAEMMMFALMGIRYEVGKYIVEELGKSLSDPIFIEWLIVETCATGDEDGLLRKARRL